MRRLLILLGLSIILISCRKEAGRKSEIFNSIVGAQPTEGFRGIRLGMPLKEVRDIEQGELIREDNFGLVYKIELGSGREARLEYYQDAYSSQDSDTLMSIIGNFILRDEIEANALYRELETWLTELHGVADGKLGAYQWASMQPGEGNVGVSLRLDGEKEQISLNYYRPDEFYEKFKPL